MALKRRSIIVVPLLIALFAILGGIHGLGQAGILAIDRNGCISHFYGFLSLPDLQLEINPYDRSRVQFHVASSGGLESCSFHRQFVMADRQLLGAKIPTSLLSTSSSYPVARLLIKTRAPRTFAPVGSSILQ